MLLHKTLLACFGVIVFCHSAFAERCENSVASLLSFEGSVSVRWGESEGWQKAEVGDGFCYGDTLQVTHLRAVISLENDTLVKLNQGSTIKFLPPDESFWVELVEGAARFISRTPKKFKVKAPYLNAAVEGTEFVVNHAGGFDSVGVIEGVVIASNELGSTRLEAGLQSTASPGAAPSPAFTLKLQDLAAWSLYMPPAYVPTDDRSKAARAYLAGNFEASYRYAKEQGDEQLEKILSLYFGQFNLEEAPQNKANTVADHIVSVLHVLVLEGPDAASRNLAATPQQNRNSASYLLLESYIEQAQGNLNAALDLAQKALLQSGEALVKVRVAELALMSGERSLAERMLADAAAEGVLKAYASSLRALLALMDNQNKLAVSILTESVNDEPSFALSRMMLGMAHIRKGKLQKGREEVEHAVALDPNNSVYRSYLGRIYFGENRISHAGEQLELAKQLDENDPTPWLFEGMGLQDQGKYSNAIKTFEKSIELNEMRKNYRTSNRLIGDLNTKAANIGASYRKMGFEERAERYGYRALQESDKSYSAYKLLMGGYLKDPLHGDIKANYRLKSTILQPLGTLPVSAGLQESLVLAVPGAGPEDLGVAEYSRLFDSDGVKGRFGGFYAESGINAIDMSAVVKSDLFALGASKYRYRSEGDGVNKGVEYEVGSAIVHMQPKSNLNIQFEISSFDSDEGDYRADLTGLLFSENYNVNSTSQQVRFSAAVDSERQFYIFNFIDNQRKYNVSDVFYNRFDGSEANFLNQVNVGAVQGDFEFATLLSNSGRLIVGGSSLNYGADREVLIATNGTESSSYIDSDTFYTQLRLNPLETLFFEVGLDYVKLDELLDQSQGQYQKDQYDSWLHSAGFIWDPLARVSIRIANSQMYSFDPATYSPIKPVQIAGFEKGLRFASGVFFDMSGAGLDVELPLDSFLYFQFQEFDVHQYVGRVLRGSFFYMPLEFELSRSEAGYSLPLNKSLNVGFSARGDKYQRKKSNELPGIMPLSLQRDRLEISLYGELSANFNWNINAYHIDQRVSVETGPNIESDDRSSFKMIDIKVSYENKVHNYSLSLGIANLTNEKDFEYYSDALFGAQVAGTSIIGSQRVFASMELSF